MTCIVGLIENNNVYMGGDSAGVAGYDLTIRADSKIFKNGPFLFGFTSSFRMGQLLRYKFKAPYHKQEVSIDEYMMTDFIDEIRKCFKEGGYAEIKDNHGSGGSFLVGYKGKLFRIEYDYQVGIGVDNFSACGCGEPFALASLYNTNGLNMKPEERIKKALETAEYFSAGVRGPFVILNNGE